MQSTTDYPYPVFIAMVVGLITLVGCDSDDEEPILVPILDAPGAVVEIEPKLEPPKEEPWLDDTWIVLNPEPVGAPRLVRLIYFLPKDREYRADMVDEFRASVRKSQEFFAEQMGVHGQGRLTFEVETAASGGV